MSIVSTIRDLFSPVLSDRQLKNMYQRGKLILGDISEQQIQPNSIDLRLGDTFSSIRPNRATVATSQSTDGNYRHQYSLSNIIKNNMYIDPSSPIEYTYGTFGQTSKDSNKEYMVQPGEFVLMTTKEVVSIPNGYVAFVCGRSSVARIAIQTEQAGLIDAGFTGQITLEVYNQSQFPISLIAGMRIAQIYFIKAKRSDHIYNVARGSKYNGQGGATGSKIHLDPELG